MRIRPFRTSDTQYIRSWITSDKVHYLWSAGRIPFGFDEETLCQRLKEEENENVSAFTAILEDGTPVGFFCISLELSQNNGFMKYIIVDGNKRGMGYGSQMVMLATKYAFEILQFDSVRLSVFDNNLPARKAYEKVGFQEINHTKDAFTYQDEKWGRYILQVKAQQEQ